MNKKIFLTGLLIWLWQINAQTEIKLMSYNLLHFPTGTEYDRTDDLKYILNTYHPDIFMVCELESQTGSNKILNNCLNHNADLYNAATFRSNTSSNYHDLQQMLYYNKDLFELTYETVLTTQIRDINHYVLKMKNEEQDTHPIYIDIYVAHLKASSGDDNEKTRANMVEVFTNDLNNIPANHYVIFAGDFNLYSSSESAYQKIIAPSNPIIMKDPGSAGNWHNNYEYRYIHTQATHSQSDDIFVGGGIDDRFDFIMLSENMFNNTDLQYINNSFKAFGNNGKCFNKSITNSDCDSEAYDFILRSHLYNMSDHLPVTLSLQTNQTINLAIDKTEKKSIYQIIPNPILNFLSIKGEKNKIISLSIFNNLGQEILSMPSYQTFTKININFLHPGIYFIQLKEKNHFQILKFVKTN